MTLHYIPENEHLIYTTEEA